ncbi:MAG: hypothetical protein NVS2B9_06220 [Myxococcales bacterium]
MRSHTNSRRPARAPRQRSAARPTQARLVADDIRRLVQGLRDSAARVQKEMGISSAQLFVLRQLGEAKSLSVNELAARTHTHQSSVSVVAQRLVERGLVLRRPGADARRVELSLTLRGRRLLPRTPEPLQEGLFAALERLPPRVRGALASSLSALLGEMGLARSSPAMFFEERQADRRRRHV